MPPKGCLGRACANEQQTFLLQWRQLTKNLGSVTCPHLSQILAMMAAHLAQNRCSVKSLYWGKSRSARMYCTGGSRLGRKAVYPIAFLSLEESISSMSSLALSAMRL